MDHIIIRAWHALNEWCDGGPTPDREELRTAFEELARGRAEPIDAPGPAAEPAENVIPFRMTKNEK